MPSLQDTLLEEFQQIQGAISASTEAWSSGGEGGGLGGGQRDTAPRGNVDSLGDQTGSIDHGGSSSTSNNSPNSTLDDVSGALAGGLGLVPLGLEIASLFEGGPSTPPTLTNYAMPDSIGFVGSTDGSGALSDLDFGQTGQPRTYNSTNTVASASAPAQSAGPSAASQPLQITVQALDAQSILDRSDDIASAVNKAILALHPISDTIQNL